MVQPWGKIFERDHFSIILARFIIVVKPCGWMIIYLLGLMDFMAGISLLLVKLKIDFFGVFFASYLILKGVLFLYDVVSILDILAGILLLFAINGYYGIITYLAVLWLLQKGIFSFLKIF